MFRTSRDMAIASDAIWNTAPGGNAAVGTKGPTSPGNPLPARYGDKSRLQTSVQRPAPISTTSNPWMAEDGTFFNRHNVDVQRKRPS